MSDRNFFERLQSFMDYKQLNNNQMTIAAGLSVGLLGKLRKNGGTMTSANIEKILIAYPELDANWLLTGRGSMLRAESLKPDVLDLLADEIRKRL